jgi:hypothetical protein
LNLTERCSKIDLFATTLLVGTCSCCFVHVIVQAIGVLTQYVFTVATDEHNDEPEEHGDTNALQLQDHNNVPRVKGHSEILRDSTTPESTTTTEYVYDGIGLYQCTHDFRHEFEHDFSDVRPDASPDSLYVDAQVDDFLSINIGKY